MAEGLPEIALSAQRLGGSKRVNWKSGLFQAHETSNKGWVWRPSKEQFANSKMRDGQRHLRGHQRVGGRVRAGGKVIEKIPSRL